MFSGVEKMTQVRRTERADCQDIAKYLRAQAQEMWRRVFLCDWVGGAGLDIFVDN